MTLETATRIDVPFLGLHYFDERHESIFFGRDEQLRDLLAKLTSARLVTVIGSSGTGKSSLVRAAAFPALRAGFLTDLRPRWRIVTMFPGSSPICNLASALETEFSTTGVEVTLRRGRLGLLEAAQQCGQRDTENLLVFVDQFEEIFRYQRAAADRAAAVDEVSAFVQMLLEATVAADSAIYVIVTMRSDYLGACAQFRNLPERINTGLYLIPRMRRDYLEDAITGPAAVMGAAFAQPLVQRMLNDAGEDPDQLPVLQHALLRTWLNWTGDKRRPREIDFDHYDKTGGVRDSINNHAEEIYAALGEADRRIAETIFKALTERDPANVDIRRPTPAGLIASIAGVSIADVARVARPFRDERVAFLRPSLKVAPASAQAPAHDLTPETPLDITHESLIRKWYRLGGSPAGAKVVTRGWVHEEAELRDTYRDLVKRARAGASPLTGTDLDVAITWRGRRLPAAWATRYDGDGESHEKVLGYIAKSENERDSGQTQRRWLLGLAGLGLMLSLIAGVALLQYMRFAKNEAELRRQAEAFRETSTARQLSAQADALRDQDSRPELSALLGIEALRRTALPEAVQALRWPLALLHRPQWSKDTSSQQPVATDDDLIVGEGSLRFSPSGRYLALRVAHGALRVHDASDGRELSLPPFEGRPSSLSWSGDELLLLVNAADTKGESQRDLIVRAITPGALGNRELLKVRCRDLCNAELTRDGTRLLVWSMSDVTSYPLAGGQPLALGAALVAADGSFVLRRVEQQGARRRAEAPPRFSLARDRKPIGEIQGDDAPNPVVDLGPTSNVLALSGRAGQIRIYEKEPEPSLAGQVLARGVLEEFGLSPDGELLATGNDNGEVRVLKWKTQRPVAGWSHPARIASVAFSPDGRSVASVDYAGGLRLVPLDPSAPGSFRDWVPLAVVGESTPAWSFPLRGRFVLARGARLGASSVFDITTGDALLQDERPALMALSPDGTFVAAAFSGSRLLAMNLETKTRTDLNTLLAPGRLTSLSISANGRFVAARTAGAGRTMLQVVDVGRRAIVRLPESVTTGTGQTFSPDGRWIALYQPGSTGQPAVAVLVDCQTWEVAGTWEFSTQAVSITFSSDGRSLLLRATGARRSEAPRPTYRFIDTSAKKERASYLPDGAVLQLARYSPDGTMLAIATREPLASALRIFETASGQPIANLLLDGPPSGVAISADNHYLGVVSNAAGIKIFELPSGREVSRASLHENERALQPRFSDDGQSIEFISSWTSPSDEFSATEFGIRRLRLSPDALIRDACARVARPLSHDEWKKYLPDDPYRDTCKDLSSSKDR